MSQFYQGRGRLLLVTKIALVLDITLVPLKEYFRQNFFECLDTIVSCIRDRFDQPGYRVLKNLEDLILKAVRNEEYF